jgi:hypothetical protein
VIEMSLSAFQRRRRELAKQAEEAAARLNAEEEVEVKEKGTGEPGGDGVGGDESPQGTGKQSDETNGQPNETDGRPDEPAVEAGEAVNGDELVKEPAEKPAEETDKPKGSRRRGGGNKR